MCQEQTEVRGVEGGRRVIRRTVNENEIRGEGRKEKIVDGKRSEVVETRESVLKTKKKRS